MDDRNRLTYCELNEHGIIYRRETLSREQWGNRGGFGNESSRTGKHLIADDIALTVFRFLWLAKDFYLECEYYGNIEVTIRMREVNKETLMFKTDRHPGILEERKSVESEVSASDQCLPHDLTKAEAVYTDFHRVVDVNCSGRLTSVGDEGEWWDEWRK